MVKKEKLSLNELLETALVKEDDQPYDVPKNWVWSRLGSVCIINPSKATTNLLPDDLEVSFIPMTAVSETSGSIVSGEIRKLHAVKKGYTNFIENDILFAKITPCMENGKVAIAERLLNGIGYGSTEFHVIRTSKCVMNKFAYYLVRAEWFREEAQGHMSGSVGQQRVPKQFMENYYIALPPLSEQQRIVDLIESLFEKLDRAKELVLNALDSFEERKLAILHKALTGELTAKWREKNGVIDVEMVLSDLCKYRLDLVKTPAERVRIENVFMNQERNSNIQLPKGWRYVTLEKLCESFQYGTSTKSDDEGEVVVIRMGNLQSGKIDWTNLKYTSDKEDIEKYILKKGDVLFNRTNSPELVGKTSIYLGEKPAIFAGYLIRINKFEQLDSSYLNYLLNTSFAKEYCMRVKTDGVNQSNINAQKLAKFEIPFCSINEQKEIVRILDNLLENEQKAKELYDVIESIDLMKKSLLARAFRGELSTNNPNEESTLELLKEVLRERVES
ncbi:MAG: restriction endonuclease subunit S [Desulfitobacterium hafniense]|nr:restriction endonuclease subunit S [Desulfitobacterium hafniense]